MDQIPIDITPIEEFLACKTGQGWIDAACENIEILLIDHANCEKKAAASAMNLMYRYVDRSLLLKKMSQLAREELLHFEQVVRLMEEVGVEYLHIGPSRYAASLREHIRTHEPAKLVDTLIVGAYVEARSCERFACLAPYLNNRIRKFYLSLLKSEARHFEDYLELARLYSREMPDNDVEARISFFAEQEAALVDSADEQFRFHSGNPA